MLAPHRHRPDLHGPLEDALQAPSLYDECLRLLARRGFPVPRTALERELATPHAPDRDIVAIWVEIYREAERHFDLYELAEELIDVEDAFQQWRFRHLKTVERIIGMRAGTGGTTGAAYLKQALNRSFFPEIWAARTEL